jgi:hypothetical protein
MLIFAVVVNFALGCLYLFIAQKIWKLRRRLIQASDALLSAERSVHQVLYGAPDFIYKGKAGSRLLRDKYRVLEVKVQRAQQAMTLLGLGNLLLQGRLPLLPKAAASRRRSTSKSQK